MKKIVFMLMICVFLTGCSFDKTYVTTDIKEYGQYKGQFESDGIVLMPKSLDDIKEVIFYKYISKRDLLYDSHYIRLKCRYDKEKFKKKLAYISTYKNEYGEVTENTSEFNKLAYFWNYDIKFSNIYEFVLVNKEKKEMEYVFVQFPLEFKGEKYMKRINEIYDEYMDD